MTLQTIRQVRALRKWRRHRANKPMATRRG